MKEIQLSLEGKYKSLNKVAFVDDEDFEFLNQWRWHLVKPKAAKTMYAARADIVNGKKVCILMHRVILNQTNPQILVDHKDKNGLNNQRHNLRTATKSQNGANTRPYKNNSSGFLGVMWDAGRNKWRAEIRKNGKGIHIGRFNRKEDAALAYNRKAISIHGEFASLNKIIA